MEIKTADEAVEAYKSFDDWQYADREAAWKWMFEQGRLAGREACAKQLELTGPDVLLMAGEMTRGELGTVMAVLSCLRVRMRSND